MAVTAAVVTTCSGFDYMCRIATNKGLQPYLRDAAFELPLCCIQPLPNQVMRILLCQQEYTSQCMQHAVLYVEAFQLVHCLDVTKCGKETH